MPRNYAHSVTLPPPNDTRPRPLADWQLLAEHLSNVAVGAKIRAEAACPHDPLLAAAAEGAGWLHDLGKYHPAWQDYLFRSANNLHTPRVPHADLGAAFARSFKHIPLAYAVLGHHAGLYDHADQKARLAAREGGQAVASLVAEAIAAARTESSSYLETPPKMPPLTAETGDLWTRLLFSCLVDADWTDTGDFLAQAEGRSIEPEPPALDERIAASWLRNVRAFIAERAAGCLQADVRQTRADVLTAAVDGAGREPGLFRFSVPTGGGKTLSALAFALEHARRHGLRRIVYVAPYLSILEQNARVIRQALGIGDDSDLVFEHHSLIANKSPGCT